MGDVAQLPPVMQTESPAQPGNTAGYNLQVQEITLTSCPPKRRTPNPVQCPRSGMLANETVEISPS